MIDQICVPLKIPTPSFFSPSHMNPQITQEISAEHDAIFCEENFEKNFQICRHIGSPLALALLHFFSITKGVGTRDKQVEYERNFWKNMSQEANTHYFSLFCKYNT